MNRNANLIFSVTIKNLNIDVHFRSFFYDCPWNITKLPACPHWIELNLGHSFRVIMPAGWWFKYANDLVSQSPKLVGEELRLKMMTEKRGKWVVALPLTSMAYFSGVESVHKLV